MKSRHKLDMRIARTTGKQASAEESSPGPVTHFLSISYPEINIRGPRACGAKEEQLTAVAGGQGQRRKGSRAGIWSVPTSAEKFLGTARCLGGKEASAPQDLRMHALPRCPNSNGCQMKSGSSPRAPRQSGRPLRGAWGWPFDRSMFCFQNQRER